MSESKLATARAQGDRAYHRRQLLAVTIGNAVEWFDWYLYALLATYFASHFFPATAEGSLVPLLSALAIFAVGFFARPFGGLVIGILADRFGRRRALSYTIVGMGLGSLMIGLAPTYAQIGIVAPVLLLAARIIQGISTGGEYAAGSAFAIESAEDGRRGYVSSLMYVSATTALLAAISLVTVLTSVLDADTMAAWGWRIPFLVGSLTAVVGLWVRTRAEETLQPEAGGASAADRPGLFDFFRQHPKQTLQVFALTAAPAVVFYMWTSFLPTFANITVGLDLKHGLRSGLISLTVFLAVLPIFGKLSDRFGRKPLLFVFGGFFTVATVPLLGSLQPTFASLLFVQTTGLVFLACNSAIAVTVVAELFPAHVRSAGSGFPYAVAVAVFGGTGPYLATYFAKIGNPSYFGWYIAALSLVSIAVYALLPETARKPLR